MAANQINANGRTLSVAATHPTTPLSGQPLRLGELTGVATFDEGADGNVTADLGSAVYALSVKGANDSGNTAVSAGDPLYYVDADINDGTGFLSKKASGRFFGVALAGVTSGATSTINVLKAPSPGSLSGASLNGAQAALAADAAVVGALPVVHRIDITAGALGNTDVVLTFKERVIDCWIVLRGAGVTSTTLQVKNGASAISSAMAASGAAAALVRTTTIDSTQWEIAAGGTLRVTSASGASQPDATVFVTALRVA